MHTTLWGLDYAHHWTESERGLYPWIILLAGPETDMDYYLVYCYQRRVFSPSVLSFQFGDCDAGSTRLEPNNMYSNNPFFMGRRLYQNTSNRDIYK